MPEKRTKMEKYIVDKIRKVKDPVKSIKKIIEKVTKD